MTASFLVMTEPYDESPAGDYGPCPPVEWQRFSNEDDAISEARFMDGQERYWVQDESGYVLWPDRDSWTWPGSTEALV